MRVQCHRTPLRFPCRNIVVLIHEMYELGIAVDFLNTAPDAERGNVLQLPKQTVMQV